MSCCCTNQETAEDLCLSSTVLLDGSRFSARRRNSSVGVGGRQAHLAGAEATCPEEAGTPHAEVMPTLAPLDSAAEAQAEAPALETHDAIAAATHCQPLKLTIVEVRILFRKTPALCNNQRCILRLQWCSTCNLGS